MSWLAAELAISGGYNSPTVLALVSSVLRHEATTTEYFALIYPTAPLSSCIPTIAKM